MNRLERPEKDSNVRMRGISKQQVDHQVALNSSASSNHKSRLNLPSISKSPDPRRRRSSFSIDNKSRMSRETETLNSSNALFVDLKNSRHIKSKLHGFSSNNHSINSISIPEARRRRKSRIIEVGPAIEILIRDWEDKVKKELHVDGVSQYSLVSQFNQLKFIYQNIHNELTLAIKLEILIKHVTVINEFIASIEDIGVRLQPEKELLIFTKMKLKEFLGYITIAGAILIDFISDKTHLIVKSKSKHYKSLAKKYAASNQTLKAENESLKKTVATEITLDLEQQVKDLKNTIRLIRVENYNSGIALKNCQEELKSINKDLQITTSNLRFTKEKGVVLINSYKELQAKCALEYQNNKILQDKLYSYAANYKINIGELVSLRSEKLVDDVRFEDISRWFLSLDSQLFEEDALKEKSMEEEGIDRIREPQYEAKYNIRRRVIIHKSHSDTEIVIKRENSKQQNYRALIKLSEAATSSSDLVLCSENSTQTDISFASLASTDFIKTQPELIRIYNKVKFMEEFTRSIDETNNEKKAGINGLSAGLHDRIREIYLGKTDEYVTAGSISHINSKEYKMLLEEYSYTLSRYRLLRIAFEYNKDLLSSTQERLYLHKLVLNDLDTYCQELISNFRKFKRSHINCKSSTGKILMFPFTQQILKNLEAEKSPESANDIKDTNINLLKSMISEIQGAGGKVAFDSSEKPMIMTKKQIFRGISSIFSSFQNRAAESKIEKIEIDLAYELNREIARTLMIGNIEKKNEFRRIQSFFFSAIKYKLVPRIEVFLRIIGIFGDIELLPLRLNAFIDAYTNLVIDCRYGFTHIVDQENLTQEIDPLRVKMFLKTFGNLIHSTDALAYLNKKFLSSESKQPNDADIHKKIDFDKFTLELFQAIEESKLQVRSSLESIMYGIIPRFSNRIQSNDLILAHHILERKYCYLSKEEKKLINERFICYSSPPEDKNDPNSQYTMSESQFFQYCIDFGLFKRNKVLKSLSLCEEELSEQRISILGELSNTQFSIFIDRITDCNHASKLWQRDMKVHCKKLSEWKKLIESNNSESPSDLSLAISFRLFNHKLNLMEESTNTIEIHIMTSLENTP